MLDDFVRPRFERAALPAVRLLARAGLSPAAISWLGLALALAGATFVALGHAWVGLGLWLASRVADGLDGALARMSASQSAWGGYLDITLDMAAYCSMVLGFGAAHPQHGLLWPSILAGYALAITTTLALAAAVERLDRTVWRGNRSVQFTRGLAEAGETSAVYVLWTLFPAAIGPVGWCWCAVLAATAVQRSWLAWRHLRAVRAGSD
jgi:phosphatidylglycerophosphate synthase